MKTAISIKDSTFQAAEEYAKAHGLSRSELYSAALEEFLRLRSEQNITDKLNEVYGPMGGEDPQTREFRREAARRGFERSEW